MQEVQIRNTFIEVHSSDEDDDNDDLPRSTSDQTHARKHPVRKVVVPAAPTIPSIPEETEDANTIMSKTVGGMSSSSIVPPMNPVVGSAVQGLHQPYYDAAYNTTTTLHDQQQQQQQEEEDTSSFTPNVQFGEQQQQQEQGHYYYPYTQDYQNIGYTSQQQQQEEEQDYYYHHQQQHHYYRSNNKQHYDDHYRRGRGITTNQPPAVTIEEVNVGRHCWHIDAETMGTLSDDLHTFTKLEYEGRLSMVTEEKIRRNGVHRYMLSFDGGEISPADGVGYAFSSQLPCKKNIQKIDSIFLNRRGHICSRTHSDVSRRHAFVAPLEIGRIVDITVDVDRCLIYFGVWAPPLPPPSNNNNNKRSSSLPSLESSGNTVKKLRPDYVINNYHLLACSTVAFGDVAATCRYGSTGHFCTVLKNTNVTVSFICPDKQQ